jgi:putative FmdB family regulatory protein
MPFTYDYECTKCSHQFEAIRKLEERHYPSICPICGKEARKIISLVSFNTVFGGSTRSEHLADAAVRESEIAQAEGFTSKDEIQAAQGYAAERAKELNIPVERILGGMPSPFVGERPTPTGSELLEGQQLIKRQIAAHMKGDPKEVRDVAKKRKVLEDRIAARGQQKLKFRPIRDREQLKKDVIASQRERKHKGLGV